MTTEQLREELTAYIQVSAYVECTSEENIDTEVKIYLENYMQLILETIISKIKNSD